MGAAVGRILGGLLRWEVVAAGRKYNTKRKSSGRLTPSVVEPGW